jgi:hypothetical protein
MNRIITTSISDPLVQQPFTGKSLDFLQNSYTNGFLAVALAMIGENYNNAKAYVIKGLDAYGTNQYNEGWVLWANEIFYCPGKATTTAFSNVPVLTLTVANDATADPVTFTDDVPRNVHNNRTMVLSDAVSGSGTFDLSDAYYLCTDWIANDANTSYRRDGRTVHIMGRCGASGTAMGTASSSFTLPVGFRPTTTQSIKGVIVHDTGADDSTGTLTINTDGTIWHSSLNGAGVAKWISVTGVSFRL